MRHLAAAAVAALLLPQPSAGQAPSTLTEAEFLAPLTEEHPAVVALASELAAARAGVAAAGALENPELGAVREGPSGGAEQLDLTLSWRPPHPGRRRLAVTAAQAGVEAAGYRLDQALLELELRLREVFARWAVAAARSEHLADHAARIESLAARERLRAEAGESSGLAARRLALAAVEVRATLARAEAEADGAAAAARTWRPDLAGARPALPALPELAPDPLAGTQRELPRLAALEAELVAARRERELAERVLSMPAVVAGWQRQEGAEEAVSGPILGLSWPIPVLDRNRPERLAADARVAALSARLELVRRELAAEGEGRSVAYRRLRKAALDAIAASRAGDPAIEAATAAFRAGEMDLTDLLETLRSASGAGLAALELHESALAAGRELVRVNPGSLDRPRPFTRHGEVEAEGPESTPDEPTGETP